MERFFKRGNHKIIINYKVILMKSILFIAFLALATIGCDTPEKSTGSDTSTPPMSSDTATTQPSGMSSDTSTTTMPVDTTTSTPNPSDTTRLK